jgi:hypothetical protein
MSKPASVSSSAEAGVTFGLKRFGLLEDFPSAVRFPCPGVVHCEMSAALHLVMRQVQAGSSSGCKTRTRITAGGYCRLSGLFTHS